MTETTNAAANLAQTLIDHAKELGQVETLMTYSDTFDLSLPHLVSVPTGRKIENLTQHLIAARELHKPMRRKGTAKLHDLASLILWANRFKSPDSALFANPDMAAPSLTCIADYHAAGPATVTDADPTARHCHHRATYAFPLSDEWKAWTRVSSQPMEKETLGEFIETNAKDIHDPTPGIIAAVESDDLAPWENKLIRTANHIQGRFGQLHQLLALSKRFQVFETSDLTVTANSDTGESSIQFLNEHKGADGKPINLPNLLIIAIPVFLNGPLFRMAVRFRYRKKGPSVVFIMTLYNPEKVFEAAFDDTLKTATEATGLPILIGHPES